MSNSTQIESLIAHHAAGPATVPRRRESLEVRRHRARQERQARFDAIGLPRPWWTR